ncbi:hypothetical protein CMI42_05380 [Candidatus Pacearchaeota archaeon]|nr:hypothetical protein [Candidatus Pacearchaeota archaeon]|tara:strand:- start:313 stop:579 length:267 start_codon:yes stop_codon:yes gene_type:complete
MRISDQKKEKIVEQILHYLFQSFPETPFTAKIARETARDEEFIKKLLLELKEKNIVVAIQKDNKGNQYSRKIKWKLSSRVYDLYHSKQ